MRQHAIPQNILDIEFKLFTKFTVREFIYMAVGIGFGGIFLYFFTTGAMPGIIAFPIFLLSSGLGLFLGLVDINDQKADVFLRNYIWAITHPTQRVWKNEMIDNKLGQLKPDLNITQGTKDRGINQENTEAEVIGGASVEQKQFIEQSKIDDIEREEAQRLQEITQAATQTASMPTQQQQISADIVNTTQPVTPIQPQLQPQTQQQVQQPTIAQTQQPPQIQNLRIDVNNINNFTTTFIKQPPYTGNLIFKVMKKDNTPVQQVLLVIKDNQGRVLSALQSDENGEIISNKIFPPSIYTIQLQTNGLTFPTITLLMDWNDIKPIKILAN